MLHKILTITLFTALSLGCSNIRLRYEGTVQTKDGKVSNVMFEKSYAVKGGIPEFCIMTGIFMGGACWYYIVMPTVLQKNDIVNDATKYVRKSLNDETLQPQATMIDRISWEDLNDTATLSPMAN